MLSRNMIIKKCTAFKFFWFDMDVNVARCVVLLVLPVQTTVYIIIYGWTVIGLYMPSGVISTINII